MKMGYLAFGVGLAVLSLGGITAAAAQKKPRASAKAAPISAEAKQVFETRCVPCHGAEGKGNGAAASALNPKPRDWTDVEWQKSTTDEAIGNAISMGGLAVGKSALMPGNPDLKPEVVADLVKLVRSYSGK
jgi:mono/diheme cytochrome c family protein